MAENQTPRQMVIELIGSKAVRELEKAGLVIRDEMRGGRLDVS